MGSLRNGAIRAKILIWGAPGAGKTATLKHVGSKLKSNQKGEVQTVTLDGPPCTYELLPVELGDVKGVATKLDYQTVPGAWGHSGVRKKLLQGVDGLVFVGNSIGTAMKDNQRSLAELDEMLKGLGRSLVTVPVVFQWMNQKAIGSIPTDEMHAKLNKVGAQTFSVSSDDPGAMLKAFAAISKMAVKVVRDDYDAGRLSEPAPETDLEDTVPPLEEEPAAAAPKGEEEFESIAADLADDLGDDFGLESPRGGTARPAGGADSDSDGLPSEEMPLPEDLDALLDGGSRSSVKAAPAPRANGGGLTLLGAGEPTLSPDGTLRLPIRIGNGEGEELSMTISVRVTPEGG